MTTEPKVAIIIVNWNGLKDTVECVESLLKIHYRDYYVIIVDNNSSDFDGAKLEEKFKEIKLVQLKRNLGFALANNVGILLALANHETEYVLLLNNDTVVDPPFLSELIKIAEADSKIGILGPKMYYHDDKTRLWYAGGKINMYTRHTHRGGKIDMGQYDVTEQTDFVSGACMLIRRNVFKDIGLLPKEYFLGWEDIDFCLSAKIKGHFCVFVPNARIWHKGSVSFKRYSLGYKQVFLGFRNRFIMRYKFLSRFKFAGFILIQFSIVVPLHILYYSLACRDPKRVTSMCKGIIAGVRDLKKRTIRYNID